ncbi:hypothetical protein KACC15558_02030 [Brevibacterium ammoniilyticum]|uniref:LysM domain-containing protein n=1 Tax=Brevibacterium ammoniilyticum TaxID=1046555 RepID=A0ABP9TVZ4_9MICO
MYLLGLCATVWAVLLGGTAALWAGLPQPYSVSDLIVLVLASAATLAFSRLGLVAALGLALRLLPAGRMRMRLRAAALRWAPRTLASTLLATTAVAGSAQFAHSAGPAAPDPGWPTVPAAPRDPGWPTTGPDGNSPGGDSGGGQPPADSPEEPGPDESAPDRAPEDKSPDEEASDDRAPRDDGPRDGPRAAPDRAPRIHVVEPGESLWSIAGEFTDSTADQAELVAAIHAENRATIGADPDLIMPGQRLEIRP